jgi:hypothetical protein
LSASGALPIVSAMPIRWTISHEERLVVATTEGVVTLKDVEAYLDALVVADAMPYAKLFDASDIEPQATDHDVLMLGARMSAYAATLPGGPLAFVVTTRLAREFVDRYLNLAAASRPVNIFRTADEAQRWLDAQPR